MRSRRGLRLLMVLALGVGLLPATTALAAGCEFKYGDQAAGSTCRGEIGWSYDPVARRFSYGSVIASAKAKDPYEYKEDFACGANTTHPGAGNACSRSFDCPTRLDPEGEPMAATRIVASRRLKARPQDPWQATTTGVCRYDGRTVRMSEVMAAVREHIEKKVGRPSIIAQPPGGLTLVNFTSLFHAPEQTITELMITRPISGKITATPEYTWELGDGITGEGSGHAYDDRSDPDSPESDDYYVKAVYQTPGIKNVKLTLTWHASISLPGGEVPLEPIIFTAETMTTAKTATARLYNR